MSDQHHHGSDPIVAGLLLGNMIRQHDAQQRSDFRTIQAGFMQQGHDVKTAEILTRIYMRSQPEQRNHAAEWAKALIAVPLLIFVVMGLIGLVGWVFGIGDSEPEHVPTAYEICEGAYDVRACVERQ